MRTRLFRLLAVPLLALTLLGGAAAYVSAQQSQTTVTQAPGGTVVTTTTVFPDGTQIITITFIPRQQQQEDTSI